MQLKTNCWGANGISDRHIKYLLKSIFQANYGAKIQSRQFCQNRIFGQKVTFVPVWKLDLKEGKASSGFFTRTQRIETWSLYRKWSFCTSLKESLTFDAFKTKRMNGFIAVLCTILHGKNRLRHEDDALLKLHFFLVK